MILYESSIDHTTQKRIRMRWWRGEQQQQAASSNRSRRSSSLSNSSLLMANITNLSIPAYWHYSMCMVKTCLLISQQVLYTLMRSQCVQIFLKLKLTENNHVKTYIRQLVCIIATIQPGSIYNYNTFEVATKELLQQQGHFNINA